MATNRSISDLLYLFRDGQAPKTITPTDFEDLIQSLHPETGQFIDLPGSPGSLAAGRLWQNDGLIQMSGGGGPAFRPGVFTGRGSGLFSAAARQRMVARSQLGGAARFTPPAPTVFTPAPPGVTPTFFDNFDFHDSSKFVYASFDEGGDAFWNNDPSFTSRIYTFTNGRCNISILNESSGGKSLTSGIQDTYDAGFTQTYGYWEVTVAVDRLPGLLYECLCLSNPNAAWNNFSICSIWTDASNVQHVFQFVSNTNLGPIEITSNDGWDASQSHSYGLLWLPNKVEFYRDRQVVASWGNPGGGYNDGTLFYSKMHCNSNFYPCLVPITNTAALPKGAHVDSFYVWNQRPF